MTDVMTQLRQDHANVARVLAVLERELDSVEQGGSADYDLLQDVMRYITGYSDLHHHPAEDVLYDELAKAAPEAASDLAVILTEHEKLIDKGRRFLETVEAVEEEAMVKRADFLRIGRSYVETLSHHMEIEEQRLFPLADKMLADEAFAAISERLERQPDPLFGASLNEEYRQLWKRIEAHSLA